jgi:hypothetical protein
VRFQVVSFDSCNFSISLEREARGDEGFKRGDRDGHDHSGITAKRREEEGKLLERAREFWGFV